MNRNQGITAGAILAAGLMLRPSASVAPVSTMDHNAAIAASNTSTGKTVGEGPWLASCKYWAPVRNTLLESGEKHATVKISIQDEGGKVESETHATAEVDESECPVVDDKSGTKPWGIPREKGPVKPKIHAIIATVHDPVHSHLALAFDREIDALIMAAGDNGYVPSYYWLPWKTRAVSMRAEATAGGEGEEHNAARERQPGLIVFKRVQENEPDLEHNYSEVIYLFLVGEDPALGADGFELRNAFQYEQELATIPGVQVNDSMKSNPGLDDALAIIGPTNSGSAASLRAAIEALGATHPSLLDNDQVSVGIQENRLGPSVKGSVKTDSKPVSRSGKRDIDIAGATQTQLAGDLLSAPSAQTGESHVKYYSFSENWKFEEKDLLVSLACSGYRLNRIAELSEDGTVYGSQGFQLTVSKNKVSQLIDFAKAACPANNLTIDNLEETPLVLRFPRNISLLRNAHPGIDQQDGGGKSTPTPFLHLSLKDFGTNDSVPQFSSDQMPLSQEAQLMSIGRLLERSRVQFILVQASNPLDSLFMTQFLHRACPEARIVFIGGDLLFGRETENVPYIGTVTFSSYNLLNPTGTYVIRKPGAYRAFPDSYSESYFNAASYTFWNNDPSSLRLANYVNPLENDGRVHPSLWAVAIGADGYYPLAIVDDCASDSSGILPEFRRAEGNTLTPTACGASPPKRPTNREWIASVLSDRESPRPPSYPGLGWEVCCVCIGLLCLTHAIAVLFPRYWSPLTRDLVIDKGDQPHRRAMYIFVGTVMLFCMGFAAAYPVIPCFRLIHPDWPHTGTYCLGTLVAAAIAMGATLWKTRKFLLSAKSELPVSNEHAPLNRFHDAICWNSHLPFNVAAVATTLCFPLLWSYICDQEFVGKSHAYVGPLFSYRCLYPGSGVCPLSPVLLVLFGWYAWAVSQTLRMRFSEQNRPCLPGRVAGKSPWPLFVSDPDITECKREANSCLESNMTCLLITRQALKRLFPNARWWPTLLLLVLYLGLYGLLMFGLKLGSMDRFLWQGGGIPTPYEFLVGGIAFPLVMIALTAWLRMLLVWGSLKRGLLEPLEQLPIRYAFTRLKGLGWVEMMRQGGLLEQWRDMARSTESIRQMVHDTELREGFLPNHQTEWTMLTKVCEELNLHIATIMTVAGVEKKEDLPEPLRDSRAGLSCMAAIERCYAKACEALLAGILIPYWEDARVGMVEGEELSELPVKARTMPNDEAVSRSLIPLQLHASTVAEEPTCIRVAEEFLAIRYVSLIRAVLVNVRRLLIIVSVVFVFTIVAWNSYPFQPRQWIDEAFTGLLLLLGIGIILVFAQMHRSAILSRITDTNANQLGWDFYLRLVTFGAVPVLTWLAYQFPEVGVSLYRFIQPGLDVMK
jgi:hypothetical protein